MGRAAVVAGILSGLAAFVVLIQFLTGVQALPALLALLTHSGGVIPNGPGPSKCPVPPEPLYVFADSDSRILRPQELRSLPTYKLRIARNEIYARHGLKFQSDMKTYFTCEPWYHAKTADVSAELSSVERANIASILLAERH